MTALPRIEITERYQEMNNGLLQLIEYVPDGKLEWSPPEQLWDPVERRAVSSRTLRHIMAHIAFSRHNWLGNFVSQKIKPEEMFARTATKDGIAEVLQESWDRVLRFASEEANLDRRFEGKLAGVEYSYTGHWIYFHLLEHDIHHRAEIFHYLALLGVAHPNVDTP